MLRTAGGEAVCDAVGRLQSRSDHDFVRAVAAQVAADDKVRATAQRPATRYRIILSKHFIHSIFLFRINLNRIT